MFRANIVPGEGFRPFVVLQANDGLTATGRPAKEKYTETEDEFLGILTNASQREIDQWKQNGHPISHKITQHGAMVKAKVRDVLMTDDGRQFYIQGVKNPAGLDIAMLYYVEERFDIKFEVKS